MKNSRYFPMFVDLSDKNIVVAGGGKTALQKDQMSPFIYKKYYGDRTSDDAGASGNGKGRQSQYPASSHQAVRFRQCIYGDRSITGLEAE